MPPTSPIIVRVADPPTSPVGLGDVVVQAVGLTGALTLIAIVLGLVLGGLFILVRIRRPANAFNGETSDELSLHISD